MNHRAVCACIHGARGSTISKLVRCSALVCPSSLTQRSSVIPQTRKTKKTFHKRARCRVQGIRVLSRVLRAYLFVAACICFIASDVVAPCTRLSGSAAVSSTGASHKERSASLPTCVTFEFERITSFVSDLMFLGFASCALRTVLSVALLRCAMQ